MPVSPIIYAVLAVLISMNFSSAMGNQAKDEAPKVLLVYSSGEPTDWQNLLKNPTVLDAITNPTPIKRNVHKLALHIRDYLEKNGVSVRLARVEDFTKDDWAEIRSYDTVVFGTPSRFWNVSWEMKRFLEQIFIRIKLLSESGASGRTYAAFALAEILPSSVEALERMAKTISDSGGTLPPALRLSLALSMTDEEYNKRIDKFLASLVVLAR